MPRLRSRAALILALPARRGQARPARRTRPRDGVSCVEAERPRRSNDPRGRQRIGSPSVYVPASFAETDPGKLHEFMRRNSFAVLTSHGEGGLYASHLPLLLDADAGPQGHLL